MAPPTKRRMTFATRSTLLLLGSIFALLLPSATSAATTFPTAPLTSPSDLAYDENGRLTSHTLIYPSGRCADLIEDHYSRAEFGEQTIGFDFRRVAGEAEGAFFPPQDEEGEGVGRPPESMEDCRAVCVERGVDRSIVTAAMPHRIYGGKLSKEPFRHWFHDNCRKVEICFMNYVNKNAPLNMYWLDRDGERVLNSQIQYGERKTVCISSFVGHQFVFTDSETEEEEVLLEHTVSFTSMVSIGETPPYDIGRRNFTQEIESTLKREWTRHDRIKRTFSALGFKKGRLPDDLFASMGAFYYNNRNNRVREEWSGKGVFVNWWEQDVYFVQLPWALKGMWQARLKDLVEAWTGVELEQTDMYGLRRYEEGARLLTHVDREKTHAASLIVNVAQGNVAEPWPVEVHDHADRLHQVTMQPGDIVYYESAKCLHARNTPLKGTGAHYVNLFTHYRPTGDDRWYDKDNAADTPEPLIDVGECKLVGRIDQVGVGAVECDDASIGPFLSPTMFEASSGDDLIDWWRSVGPQPPNDEGEAAASDDRDEL